MTKPKVLVIADTQDIERLKSYDNGACWDIHWETVEFKRLHVYTNKLKYNIKEDEIDFVLYSRNDQVKDKISIGALTRNLRVGYSSFSGIDDAYWMEETLECFNDFIRGNNTLNHEVNVFKEKNQEIIKSGTFSLIFDTEQIGCIRYGLPRILEVLDRYNIKATFFITNILKQIYPNVIRDIFRQGHEIGLHGKWHEYLLDECEENQTEKIKEMIRDFDVPIHGANFIGRMDENTIKALCNNNLKYFVIPRINNYYRLSYPKLSTETYTTSVDGKNIKVVPVCVETYGKPLFTVRNMIDSAYSSSLKSNKHITLLCHPFRDGNLRNIRNMEEVIKHLIIKRRMQPILVKDIPNKGEKCISVNEAINTKPQHNFQNTIPKTQQDIVGLIPENFMLAYRFLKSRHTVW
ncbi:MAG: polysaccharide deacetylase family protein [Candidatus Altiarchaeia archaeon]